MRIDRLAVALVAAVSAALPGAAATTYRWIDANGVVNYGDAPPRGTRGVLALDEAHGRVSTVPAPPREALDRARQRALELRLERIERELDALRAASVQPVVVVAPGWSMPAPVVGAAVFAAPVWVGLGWTGGADWLHGGRRHGGWHQPGWHRPVFPAAVRPQHSDRRHGSSRSRRPRGRSAHQLLRSSRSFRNTVRGSGCSGRSGNASRSRAITVGLVSRKKVLISRSTASVET